MQLIRLVILVFEEWLELGGGVLLFAVVCCLMFDRYVWSCWLSTMLIVPGFCISGDYGFPGFGWAVVVIWKNFPCSYFLVLSLLSNVVCFVAVVGFSTNYARFIHTVCMRRIR